MVADVCVVGDVAIADGCANDGRHLPSPVALFTVTCSRKVLKSPIYPSDPALPFEILRLEANAREGEYLVAAPQSCAGRSRRGNAAAPFAKNNMFADTQ